MKLLPVQDRVVIKRSAEEEISEGGIIIPDEAKETAVTGVIVAHGTGKVLDNGKQRPVDIQVGDLVIFGKYTGVDVTLDGEELVIMKEDDLFGVIT